MDGSTFCTLPRIDVADHRLGPGLGDEVLDQDAVLEQRDLGQVAPLPDRHHPLDRLPAGQELGLGQDLRAAAGRVPGVPPALPLGLQPGGPADALDLVRRTGAGGPASRACDSRGSRTCTTVLSGSSSRGVSSPVDRRRRRRRRRLPARCRSRCRPRRRSSESSSESSCRSSVDSAASSSAGCRSPARRRSTRRDVRLGSSGWPSPRSSVSATRPRPRRPRRRRRPRADAVVVGVVRCHRLGASHRRRHRPVERIASAASSPVVNHRRLGGVLGLGRRRRRRPAVRSPRRPSGVRRRVLGGSARRPTCPRRRRDPTGPGRRGLGAVVRLIGACRLARCLRRAAGTAG